MVMLLKKLVQLLLLNGVRQMLTASEARKLVEEAENKNLQEFEEWAIKYNLSKKNQDKARNGDNCLNIKIKNLPTNQIAMEKFFNKYGYYVSYDYFFNYVIIFWKSENEYKIIYHGNDNYNIEINREE